MTGTVSIPLWLAILAGLLAAWALYDRIVMPPLRWLIRSRANKVLDEVGSKLRMEIRPFQQTRRQALIDILTYDAKVQEAVAAHALEKKMPREVVTAQANHYAREIVPAFNAYLYFRVGYWIGRKIAESLYHVRLVYSDGEALQKVLPNSTVVFVMNHRSNMDYILTAYLAAGHAALSFAVGEWARIWPLQQLIRSMGAYFVRRNSRDELYRRVLERYISLATANGVTQAVYPEGGLSRDGKLREPKLGVLDYMLRGFNPEGERDVVFVPLGINYDRVLEDRTLLLSLDAEAKKPGALRAAANTLAFAARQARLVRKSKWNRFGYACVNIGPPVSAREYCLTQGIDFRKLGREQRFARITELGAYLMTVIGRLVPVLPVPLVATVFVRSPDARLSELQIKAQAEELIERLELAGAHLHVRRRDRDYAISAGLDMLTLRHLVEQTDGLYSARKDEMPVLRYYANSIGHLLPD